METAVREGAAPSYSAFVPQAVLPVATALPLTSRKAGRRIYPNEALLEEGCAGLTRESVAMAHQLRTVSKKRLGKILGRVDNSETAEALREAMRVQLEL